MMSFPVGEGERTEVIDILLILRNQMTVQIWRRYQKRRERRVPVSSLKGLASSTLRYRSF